MGGKSINSLLRISSFNRLQHTKMLPHDGTDAAIDSEAFLADQAHLDRVDPIGVGNDGVA
ncbi:hypothetical protein D3C72_2587020 [compost metagenome]